MAAKAELQRLEGWMDSYQPMVYRAACMILRDPVAAEDVAQDTFLRAFGAAAKVNDGADIGGWLYRISVNLCLNHLRSRRREQTAVNRLVDRQSLSDDITETDATKSALEQALRKLPDRLRVPLILRYYLDFSEAQTARALSLRPGTVKSRLHEARRLLSADASVMEVHSER